MKWLTIPVLLIATRAAAQTVDDHLAKVRELYDKGDFVHARDELSAAYQLDARPELLFALGQVELHLGHFDKAIEYYEKFIATGPGAEQAALAEQAIGAARDRLTEKPPVGSPPWPPAPPRPPPHRVWDFFDSSIATLGGATLLTGAGLLVYGLRIAGDHSGTLSAYNHRISRSETTQWIGVGCLAAGALTIGSAVLRWRWHLVETELQPIVAPGTAGVSWARRW